MFFTSFCEPFGVLSSSVFVGSPSTVRFSVCCNGLTPRIEAAPGGLHLWCCHRPHDRASSVRGATSPSGCDCPHPYLRIPIRPPTPTHCAAKGGRQKGICKMVTKTEKKVTEKWPKTRKRLPKSDRKIMWVAYTLLPTPFSGTVNNVCRFSIRFWVGEVNPY